jgi:hypothetical protein
MEVEIGNAAGKVWQALNAKGSVAKAQLGKVTGLSNDQVNQAIGWLAREGKVSVEKTAKGDALKLKA